MILKREVADRLVAASVKYCNGDIILVYRLTSRPSPEVERLIGDGAVYSLYITKVYNGGSLRKRSELFDIARDEKEAKRIFRIVSRARVMPENANEIVEDLIGAFDAF